MKECKIEHGKSYVRVGLGPKDVLGNREILSELRNGYWVTIPNAMGSSKSFVEHISQAFDMIGKYDNEALAIDKRAKEIGDYIIKNKMY